MNLGYDSLNRLTSSVQTLPNTSAINGCWSYDSFGNMLVQAMSTQSLSPSSGSNPCQASSGSYTSQSTFSYTDGTNRITSGTFPDVNQSAHTGSPAYDAAGNMINDLSQRYLYDAEGRVCASQWLSGGTITGYLYDAEGHRVAKGMLSSWSCDPTALTVTSSYFIGPDGEAMTEVDGQGNWVRTDVSAVGRFLATYKPDGVHYPLTDWLGTKRVQVDVSGNIENTCTSQPFGDQLVCSNSALDASNRHFTGKERDTESGLDNFEARYYGSSMGRFMSPDPSGLVYADPLNPQSFNLYSYVLNNPLIFTDPHGLDCVYTSNQTSGSVTVETVRGDCRSDTDSGVYVDGHVDTDSYKYTQSNGNYSLNYNYTPDDGGASTIGVGKIGLDTPAPMAASSGDQLNPYAQAVFGQVAQQTAWFPDICSVTGNVRGQIPGTPIKAGAALNGNGKLSFSASWKQAGGGGSPEVSLTGRANADSAAVAQQIAIPIPDTPLKATFGANPFGGRNSYGLSADLGKGISAGGAATFGTIGDRTCNPWR